MEGSPWREIYKKVQSAEINAWSSERSRTKLCTKSGSKRGRDRFGEEGK